MFKHKRSTDDFAEEIKSHLELEADELKREGLSEDEARRKARVEFGNVPAAQERFYLKSRIVWLVNLFESNQTGPRFHLSYLDYLDWKRLNHVFSSTAVYEQDDFMLSTATGTQQANGARVSDGFFRTLGVNPALGRDFYD